MRDVQLGHLAIGPLEHQLIDLERERLVQHRPVGARGQRPAHEVAEAQVCRQPDPPLHACHRVVEQCRELVGRLGVDGRRRLVDLDVGRAGIDQALHLRREDGHERARGGDAVRIDLPGAIGQSAGQRERTRQGDLDGPSGPRDRAYWNSSTTPRPVGRRDGLQHLESMLLVVATGAQPPIGRQRHDARQMSVELGREEARATHLTVGHDIDAGVLLVPERGVDRVVLDLADVLRSQLAPTLGRDRKVQPARTGVRADDRCGHRRRSIRSAGRGVGHWCTSLKV